jgi:hypothetical protein
MLGLPHRPLLLVIVNRSRSPDDFDFWVINGAWDGTYCDGHVTIWDAWHPYSMIDTMRKLSEDQDRLRCPSHSTNSAYNQVFDNWSDPNWQGPLTPQFIPPPEWTDGIAF